MVTNRAQPQHQPTTSNPRGVWGPVSGRTAPHVAPRPGLNMSVLLVCAVVALTGAVVLLSYVGINATGLPVDHNVLDAAVDARAEAMDRIVPPFTMVGSTPVFTPVMVVIAAVIALAKRTMWPVVMLAVTATLSVGTTVIVKNTFNRERPPLETQLQPHEFSGSIPSGHTLNAVALVSVSVAMILRWAARSWVRWLTVVLAVAYMAAMALSRIYMGVHWASDVACGALLGTAIACLVIAFDVWARSRGSARQQGHPLGSANH